MKYNRCSECGGILGQHFNGCPETPEGEPEEGEETGGTCGMCDGSGKIDAHEDDPNGYPPGELKTCPQCGGSGK
jgi:hypothetical protein